MPTDARPRVRPLVVGVLAAGIAAAGGALNATPRLIWNASASVPLGAYWLVSNEPARGDLVLAEPPPDARRLAATRDYLPDHVPLVKRLAAIGGDLVCADNAAVEINGVRVAQRLAADARGRPLPAWTECRALNLDEVFLLTEAPDSFDSRYFGPVQRSAVIGKLVPIWTYGP
jgi:conjugative transfer signal peptidase TraF